MSDSEKILIESGRDNLALTIFVPWDCNKNCPFCTTKKEYAKKLASVDDIARLANDVVEHIPDIEDIVISGGEPLDDLDSLLSLLHQLPYHIRASSRVFINTSFPRIKDEDRNTFIRVLAEIGGFNVSRHVGHDYSEFASLEEIKTLVGDSCPVRINVLLNEQINLIDRSKSADVIEHIEHLMSYGYFDIQLRANYLKTKQAKISGDIHGFVLKKDDDMTSLYLSSFGKLRTSGCAVCFTIATTYNNSDKVISFHKGLKSTKRYFDDYYEVNDVIITPSGHIKLDWDDAPVKLSQIELYRDYKSKREREELERRWCRPWAYSRQC